jgi:hypothetical protein
MTTWEGAMNDTLMGRYATIEQSATYSGLSDKTLRRLSAAGKLIGYRPVPGRVLLDLQQLDALIRDSAGRIGTRGRSQRRAMP